MSFRMIANRLFKHGRLFVHSYIKRDLHLNIFENTTQRRNIAAINLRKGSQQNPQQQQQQIGDGANAIKNIGIFRFGQHARRLFVDNILNRVTTTYSADLRNDATKKFLYGDSSPFFALVGVSLASGNGILTKDDEFEGVCYEIREAVARLQSKSYDNEFSNQLDPNKTIYSKDLNINNLNIGAPIAKGCSAVVYAANLKTDLTVQSQTTATTQLTSPLTFSRQTEEMMTPIQNTSRFLHNFGGSVDNLYFNNRSLDDNHNSGVNELRKQNVSQRQRFESISESDANNQNVNLLTNQSDLFMDTSEDMISSSSFKDASTGTTPGTINSNDSTKTINTQSYDRNLYEFPFALKMMFNYDIQSNAMAILRAMYKETIPARNKCLNEDADNWEKLLREQVVDLPAHPNIVAMFNVFCAQIPDLQESIQLYPMALPQRLNPNGYGRNMSLFMLMKRYNCSLDEYLRDRNVSIRTRILLFTQLLEAVAHLYRHGISHRDLKSDNILIDLSTDDVQPILVISDFGCCLADKTNGFQLPYQSNDIDKGGNTALMAPEIITKTPGIFSILNYTKSDLWAAGAIAYEIFGERNPFYRIDRQTDVNGMGNETGTTAKIQLKNYNYNESDLPQLQNTDVPAIVQKLIENILQINPNKRLCPDIAANVMQLYLWAPSKWFTIESNPSTEEILQWLLSLTTKVLCNGKINDPMNVNLIDGPNNNNNNGLDSFGYKMGRRTYTEYLLISSFLIRSRLQRIRSALNWMQSAVV